MTHVSTRGMNFKVGRERGDGVEWSCAGVAASLHCDVACRASVATHSGSPWTQAYVSVWA
jgi:hypothetical protein